MKRIARFYNAHGKLVHELPIPVTCKRYSMQCSMDHRKMDKALTALAGVTRVRLYEGDDKYSLFEVKDGRTMFLGFKFDGAEHAVSIIGGKAVE